MEHTVIDSLVRAASITPLAGYLDPGLGAMIVSAVVGIFATLTLAVKSFWYKITAPFRRKKSADQSDARK